MVVTQCKAMCVIENNIDMNIWNICGQSTFIV